MGKNTKLSARQGSVGTSRRRFLLSAITAPPTLLLAEASTGLSKAVALDRARTKHDEGNELPSSLSPGVRVSSATVQTADEAAARAVALAEEAGSRGTFAVGGLLVDDNGRVIAEAVNAVIRDDRLSDPTAHVERQLVDWFAYNRHGAHLSPRNVTIISSLDPCAMCAGAILRAGMRVIAVAEDNFAGVHKDLQPHHVPAELRSQAERDMSFFGVQGTRPKPTHVISLLASEISDEHVARSTATFGKSLDAVKQKIGEGTPEGPRLFKPSRDTPSQLREVARGLPQTIEFPARPLNIHDRASRHGVAKLLENDGSALVDEEGNVILAVKGAEQTSHIRTSALELIRAYTSVRRRMNDNFKVILPHQRYCTIVKGTVPGQPAKGLLELGATGSFLEQKRLTEKLPAMAFIRSANVDRAQKWAASLPQLYQEIHITAGAVGS